MASGDLSRVAEIHVDAWRSAYAGILPDEVLAGLDVRERTELWENTLFRRPSRTNLVLEESGRVQGWCALGPARDEDEDARHTGEVYGLFVHPGSQRRGYGTALLTHAHQTFRDRACRQSVLWVVEGNAPARGFYEHRCYELDPGRRRVTEWLNVPEVRYRRKL